MRTHAEGSAIVQCRQGFTLATRMARSSGSPEDFPFQVRGDLLDGSAHVLRQHVGQPFLAEFPARPLGLGEAIREEDKRLAGPQIHRGIGQFDFREHSEQRSGHSCELDGTVGGGGWQAAGGPPRTR